MKLQPLQLIQTQTATDGSTKIIGYNHNIIFKNITFSKPAGDQVEAEYVFGNFKTAYTSANCTIFDESCNSNVQLQNKFTTIMLSSALTIDNIDPALIVNEDTPTGHQEQV